MRQILITGEYANYEPDPYPFKAVQVGRAIRKEAEYQRYLKKLELVDGIAAHWDSFGKRWTWHEVLRFEAGSWED